MRNQLEKLTINHSTSAERKFSEILKKFHIPFQTKVKIKDREVDFLIGKYAIDIDGHKQDVAKNKMLIKEGYSPIHFENKEIPNPNLIEWLRKL